MKKAFVVTCLLIIAQTSALAQEQKSDSLQIPLNKNSINLSLGPGGLLVLFLPAHLSYERLFQGKVFGSKNSSLLEFGAGGAAFWGGSGLLFISRFGILTGRGRRHFEAKAGICILNNIFPSACIGYRKQKPGSRFIFRTGIGFPDALYVSWGVSF